MTRPDFKGENNPFFGKKHTAKTIRRISEAKTGHITSEVTRKKLSKILKGKKRSEISKKKYSESKKGDKNPNWAGDDMKNAALHIWVNKYKAKPIDGNCEICHEKPWHDLANITGTYSRDFENWQYQCRSCHMKDDGRMKNLKQFNGGD